MSISILIKRILSSFVIFFIPSILFAQTLDGIEFGNPESEMSHHFRDNNGQTRVVAGQFGHFPRQISPPAQPDWMGGSMFFTLKVDPNQSTYLTVQFWGEDINPNQLYIYIDGKLLGYRHIGDYDILHHGTSDVVCRGQFYYISTVIPEHVTKGKTELELEIRLHGRIWSYGANFEQFQKNIDGPSLPIYGAYTHLGAKFEPPKVEFKPVEDRIRPVPDTKVVDRIKERISAELLQRLNGKKVLTQQDAEFLARGYRTKWSPVYGNQKCVERIVESIEAFYQAWQENPKLIENDPRQYNGDWFGVAPLCEAIILLGEGTRENMLPKSPVPGSPSPLAWSDMIHASMVHLMKHRRWYTNQSMIIDWNIYRMNRALQILDPSKAIPEGQALRYLYESMGIEPWRGAETDTGPSLPRGESYYQTTPQGLTRELGYVGMYGEVLDWGCLIYLSTCKRDKDSQLIVRPDGTLDGDDRIREQLIKMTHARLPFRYPSTDNDGFRAMRLERSIGWRDNELVGPVLYCARTGKEGVSLLIPYCTRDSKSMEMTQQALSDNQIFGALEELNKVWSLRVSNALMGVPEYWEYVRSCELRVASCEKAKQSSEPGSVNSRNMSEGNTIVNSCGNTSLATRNSQLATISTPHSSLLTPHFSDSTDGVAVIQNGEERLYISVYWRARLGINRLAKVHYIGKYWQQYAVVRTEVQFTPDGRTWTRKNWTTSDHNNGYGHIHYPIKTDSIHEGEVLPIAKIPDWDTEFQLGKENGNAGRADSYTVQFGQYKIKLVQNGELKIEN